MARRAIASGGTSPIDEVSTASADGVESLSAGGLLGGTGRRRQESESELSRDGRLVTNPYDTGTYPIEQYEKKQKLAAKLQRETVIR